MSGLNNTSDDDVSDVKRDAIYKDMLVGAQNLEHTLNNLGILSRVSDVENGLETRRYDIELPADTRAQRIVDLSDNIAFAMGVSGVHIAAVPSKKIVVSITVPNGRR